MSKEIFELYHFIVTNNCEFHINEKETEMIIFIDSTYCEEFFNLTREVFVSYFEDGIEITMREGYMAFNIVELIEYYGEFDYWITKFREICD